MICSTSIERIVTGRNAALAQTEALIQQLGDISTLTRSIGGITAQDWAMKQDFRCGCWLMEKRETAMKAITRNLDRSIWRDLLKKSGMLSLMDAEARNQWYNSLEKDDIPAISEENILNTFEQLHQSKAEVFEHGIINVFKGLSWGWKRDRLADLERMLMILDGKPVPDNRADVTRRLSDHIHESRHSNHYEDEMFAIKYFQKGTAHITLKRTELLDKLNNIITRHYPGALAAR
ncbi:DUF4942 domain-containing protein [Enterobacter mori]